MLLKLLILIVVAVFIYRAARQWFGPVPYRGTGNPGSPPEKVDDEMIKDPQCGVYFPRRSAVALTEHRPALFFCSIECRDRYMAGRSDEASE